MEPPTVARNRRNRLFRNYTIDEDDPNAEQDPRSSLHRAHHDELQGNLSMGGSFYSEPSTSRAPTESIHSTTRDVPLENGRVHAVPDDNNPSEDSTVMEHSRKTSIVRSESQRRDLRNFEFNLATPTSQQSSYANSVLTSQAPSQTTGLTSASTSRLPDFFSSEVFQTVLHNPTTSHQLLAYSRTRMCGENMHFLEKAHKYRDLLDEVTKTMFEIHKDFLSPGGRDQVNISEPLLLQVRKDMKHTITEMLPRLEVIFDDVSSEIERLVATDIYPRFVRHQLVISASKALVTDRSKYAGLGDCFVLTNPTKADNPIVYASDGFVKVTGYSRSEIIPRNCRFLQGRQTDRSAVKRLKLSIEEGQESVELLLNYKKTGEPFWNLLYVTPLFDWEGKLAFFLGGQINCSTTIHNANDILRILAYNENDEEQQSTNANPPQPQPQPKSDGGSFFKRFRSHKNTPSQREAGMETGLLNRIEKLNLSTQMAEFYTAYSKFIVVNAVTQYISFHSYGIMALLYPVKPHRTAGAAPGAYPENFNVVRPPGAVSPTGALPTVGAAAGLTQSVAGQDIFKFLMHHTLNSLSRDYKSTVKHGMKTGQPVSLELTLCTRRRMGFERFITHWTPLKDEMGRTEFMVLTLGSLE